MLQISNENGDLNLKSHGSQPTTLIIGSLIDVNYKMLNDNNIPN